MNEDGKRLKIFIIDDDLAIRQCLKTLLTSLYDGRFDIYSSGDGVQGLGLLYILNPDLIIIDTTLPEYSGRELIDYVTSNGRFTNTKLIVIDDRGDLVAGLNPNITVLSKKSLNFVSDLETNVTNLLGQVEKRTGWFSRLKHFLIRKTLSWSNRSDLVMYTISKGRNGSPVSFVSSLFLFPLWVISQIIASLGLSLLFLSTGGRIKDANLPQAASDNKAFRVLVYPTLIGVITAAIFFIIQIGLFVAGGVVIFNSVKLESIFANNSPEVNLNFNTAIYDTNLVELVEGELRLKEQFATIEVEDDIDSPTGEMGDIVPEQSEQETNNEIQDTTVPENNEDQPIVEEDQDTQSDVLGTHTETVSSGYSTSNPVISFGENIEFSNLVRIEEESSVNTDESSIPDINSTDPKIKDVSIDALTNKGAVQNTVTYQLSPNNIDWYYFNANNVVDNGGDLNSGWERTEQGFVSSNTVQEINQYLPNYVESVSGNVLYLRIYLHSDGANQVWVRNVKVVREQNIVTLLDEEVPEEEIDEELASFPLAFPVLEEENADDLMVVPDLPSPTIFQATYVNGNKVVYGKILESDIPDEELGKFKVRVYYTDSTDISRIADNKGELIGETNLERNDSGDLSFLLITPNREGGYVTADLVYEVNGSAVVSRLSRPLENSTFTVDSTADTADHTLNGICSVGTATGGACTLRAAIAEANSVGGSDNIYFNIPTSDAGYRDYDTPDSASSGDSTGGDDYWTIRPASVFPTIIGDIMINGTTQESNQGDRNTFGPDIELNGDNFSTTSSQTGLSFNTGVTAATINNIVINGFDNGTFHYGIAINGSSSNIGIYRTYMGTDIKGLSAKLNYRNILLQNTATNVTIGTTTSDGNLIVGGTNEGITLSCQSSSPSTNVINIKGNRFGMNATETSGISSAGGTLVNVQGNCNITIGGTTVNERNLFGGATVNPILLNLSANDVAEAKIYNNIFGTNSSGVVNLGCNRGIATQNSSTNSTAGHPTTEIGKEGAGNLFKYCTGSRVVSIESDRNYIVAYNSFGNATNGEYIRISPTTMASITNTIIIKNNYLGATESDPYFNVSLSGGLYSGIINRVNSLIVGNYINSLSKFAIYNAPINLDTRNSTATDTSPKPTIGGQNLLTGSLCNGLEKNCISGNQWGGIFSQDTVPANESTLWADNSFAGGNGIGGSNNIEQSWLGLFELASSNYRRTDLTGTTLTFPTGTKVRTTDDPASIVTSATAINATCLGTTGVSCTTSSHTTGTLDNTYVAVPSGQTSTVLSNVNNWFRITQYIYDGTGTKVDYSSFKFDQPHFSSPTFTFDGNSTNNVINTGTSRVIDTQTYTDRGEPWTDKPLATRNIATGDIGRFQIMEVEYVDANPILNEENEWIITVDSTEAIGTAAGTTYSNDGTGTASGGMSKLATATLANGKTSFREAIITANNFDQPMEIKFNIPTSDTGFINPNGSRNSPSQPAGTYPVTPLGYWTIEDTTPSPTITITKDEALKIDGYSIPGTSKNTAAIGETFNAQLRIQLNLYYLLLSTSNNVEITGLNLTGHDNSVRVSGGVNTNVWIHGNYLGTQIDGSHLTVSDYTNTGGPRFVAEVNGVTLGTNGDGINDRGEFNIISGANGGSSGIVTVLSNNPVSNLRISGNYIFTDKTGNACSPFNGDRAAIETGGSYQMQNIIIGSNLDSIADSDEGNVMGCINTNYRAYIRAFALNNAMIAGNYMGISPSGTDLRDGGTGASYAVNVLGSNNTRFMNNTIKAYASSDLGTLNVADNSTNLTFKNNRVIGGTVAFGGIPIGAILESNIFENYTDVGAFVGATGANVTFKDNQFLGTGSSRKILHLGNFAAGSLPPAVNDSGDTDTGANNLMNYPVIQKVTYLSGGKYKIEGILDNNVALEAPFDIEVCLSDNHSSGHGGCIESLGYFENAVPQVSGGINPFSVEVTIDGDNGTQDHIFTSLATNNLGSTSEFSLNFNTTDNPNFSLAKYPITLTNPSDEEELTDTTPLLDWNDSGDLDLKHYEIYLNGSFYALVLANQTNLQVPSALPAGEYSWQIVGVRKDNTESGRSVTRTFTIAGEAPLSYPVVIQPITDLPPVSFIPREDDPLETSDQTGMNILTAAVIALISLGVVSASVLMIQKYRRRN